MDRFKQVYCIIPARFHSRCILSVRQGIIVGYSIDNETLDSRKILVRIGEEESILPPEFVFTDYSKALDKAKSLQDDIDKEYYEYQSKRIDGLIKDVDLDKVKLKDFLLKLIDRGEITL